jgi:hypothetical protein
MIIRKQNIMNITSIFGSFNKTNMKFSNLHFSYALSEPI